MATKVTTTLLDDAWIVYQESQEGDIDDEGTSAVKFHFTKDTNSARVEQFAKETQKIQQYCKEGKLYELLALDLPEIATTNAHFKAYKEALKTTLQAYIFLNTASSIDDKCGFLKITGEDFSDMHRSPIPNASPYEIKKSSLFKITPVAAKALCMAIAENKEINSLILASANANLPQNELDEDDLEFEFIEGNNKPSLVNSRFFSDEVARIFADNLPMNRFRLLHIAGDFGNAGATVLANRLSHLLVPYPTEIGGVKILGTNVDKATGAQIARQVQSCIQNRLAKELNFMLV